jgi:hypothetical protein
MPAGSISMMSIMFELTATATTAPARAVAAAGNCARMRRRAPWAADAAASVHTVIILADLRLLRTVWQEKCGNSSR